MFINDCTLYMSKEKKDECICMKEKRMLGEGGKEKKKFVIC